MKMQIIQSIRKQLVWWRRWNACLLHDKKNEPLVVVELAYVMEERVSSQSSHGKWNFSSEVGFFRTIFSWWMEEQQQNCIITQCSNDSYRTDQRPSFSRYVIQRTEFWKNREADIGYYSRSLSFSLPLKRIDLPTDYSYYYYYYRESIIIIFIVQSSWTRR